MVAREQRARVAPDGVALAWIVAAAIAAAARESVADLVARTVAAAAVTAKTVGGAHPDLPPVAGVDLWASRLYCEIELGFGV